MHKYMRAIGFSEYTDRKKLKELLTDVIMNSDHRAYTMNQEGILLGEFSKNHTHTKGTAESGTFGVAVCGEFDDNDKFKIIHKRVFDITELNEYGNKMISPMLSILP